MNKVFAFFLILIIFPAPPLWGKVFTDKMGRKVMVKEHPERIVSLSPGITEILFTLGLGGRIAGVTEFSDYPIAARDKPRVGSYVNLNLEMIVSLNPDLIIGTADGNKKDSIEKLEEWGMPVYTVYPRNFQGILDSIERLGMITGKQRQAQRVIDDIHRRKDMVTKAVAELSRRRVFVQIETSPLITVGRNTFWDSMITLAGGENIASGKATGYPRYSLEDVLMEKPDVILVTSMVPVGGKNEQLAFWLKWKTIPAVRNRRVFLINPDLVDRPGPRIIEGLERLARIIHPEAFITRIIREL